MPSKADAEVASTYLQAWPAYLRTLVLIGFITALCVSFVRWLASPLRKYPGPWIAGFTDLYRLSLVLTNEYQVHLTRLHKKYGPVVRIGPNALDLDYPELIKTLYGVGNRWIKSNFYHNNSAVVNGKIKYNVFSTPDQEENRILKKPIAKHYSSSAVLGFEPLIDNTLRDFCHELDRRFITGQGKGQTCNLGAWIAYCTWDIVGYTTFSKPFGYIEKGCDFDNLIKIADKSQDYFSAVGQMHYLDYFLDKNPIKRIGPPSLGPAIAIGVERLELRLSGKDPNFDPEKPDYLDLFLKAKAANPDTVDDFNLIVYTLINLVAGADTTATTVRAAMYYILTHAEVHGKLKEEIRSSDAGETASYKVVKALPYLDAVMKESMRLHPGVAMMLEREVPASGLKLPDGSVVPPKTAVGINPYIVHRNKGIYGEDADQFRPERWLISEGESDNAYQERMKLYSKNDLTFGGGARICLGRYISLLEAYKIVATLINRYDIDIENGGRDYKTFNRWFFRQEGLLCRIKKRS